MRRMELMVAGCVFCDEATVTRELVVGGQSCIALQRTDSGIEGKSQKNAKLLRTKTLNEARFVKPEEKQEAITDKAVGLSWGLGGHGTRPVRRVGR